ncbi:Ribosomal RNA processing protein 36-like protein, partial [Operophtera brumata]
MSSSEDSDNSIAEEEHDDERQAIRSQLSTLSFEELQKLKEKVGAKVYKEALFGTTKKNERKVFKRENKNRPREMTAKKQVPMVVKLPSLKETTDPDKQIKLRRLMQRLNDQHKEGRKQYEELKKEGTGRVQRHLKRRQQKIKKKSFRAPSGPE